MYENLLELERRQKKTMDMTLAHDRTADLRRIDRPSLIIAAKDDSLTPPYFAEDLHAGIRGSRLIVLEEGGHYSYRRSRARWNAAVDAFMAEHEGKV